MLSFLKTDSSNQTFIDLVKLLDENLSKIDGSEHAFYDQFNKISGIKYALIAFDDDKPVGCGALKQFDSKTIEVKRMFTISEARSKGIGAKLLAELESWAKDLGYYKCILETGKRQPAAIALYLKSGYEITPNYGQYIGVENSVCFGKLLI